MYITKANYDKISKTMKFDFDIETKAQKLYHDITFLTKKEAQGIYTFKLMSESPEVFSKNYFEKIKVNPKDRKFLNIKGRKVGPVYHLYSECERLTSDFFGLPIPKELEGIEDEVRAWYSKNEYLTLDFLRDGDVSKMDTLKMRFHNKFNVELKEFDAVNSGTSLFDNKTIKERVDEILELIEYGNDFGATEKEQKIVKAFSKIHYITKDDSFVAKFYNTDQVKEVMRRFNKEVRYPLINLMRDFYILKFNSELEVDRSILEQLGFKPCRCCRQRFQEEGRVEIGEKVYKDSGNKKIA